jgi:hypothetical protein
MFRELFKRLRYKRPMGIERPVPGGLYLWLVHPTRFACVMRLFCDTASIGEMFRSEALLATQTDWMQLDRDMRTGHLPFQEGNFYSCRDPSR